MGSRAVQDIPPADPSFVGRYAICHKIAAGGMATVHIGRLLGPAGFSRTVAIKRLHAQFAGDPEFVAMFLDEARLAARIHHPNVVPIVDVVTASGELLLVMEYVRGDSLSALLRAVRDGRASLSVSMAATILVGVLHGLHAAHEARGDRGEPLGIVHRDVSPQNVLVGVDGVARLVDFGVAKAAGRVQTTREGQLKGKLAYMAPEQVRGGKVARTTDVYAAAVLFWETLVGRRLYQDMTDAQIYGCLMEGSVEPPSKYAPHLPPAVDAIVLRGLSRDPEARFPTAREMAKAIEEVSPPVASSVIGEWVEATAKDALDARARLVEFVESARMPAPGGDVRPDSGTTDRLSGPVLRDGADTQDIVITQFSSSSLAAPPRKFGGRRRVALLIGAGGLVAVALVVVAVSSLRSSAAPNAARATAASSAVAPIVATVDPPLPAPTASSADVATAEGAAPAPKNNATTAPPRRRPAPTRPTANPYSHM